MSIEMNDTPITTRGDTESRKCKCDDSEGDWTVVSRRRKQRRNFFPKIGTIEQQPWIPTKSDADHEMESKLMQKMQACIQKLENSDFFHTLLQQMEASEVHDRISTVLASESKMPMVIYGIGSIESYEPPRLQLSLAILLKRKFDWVGGIEVFDPVISSTESKILEALGCSVLSENEQGRRVALKPTMFYMPHCEVVLYDNLVQANWKAEHLNQMVVFGNSFRSYENYISVSMNSTLSESMKHVLTVLNFSTEVKVETVSDDYFKAFHDSSWHYFNVISDMELELESPKVLEEN
ncbi:hypothetical protein Scep_022197 [Stephania cephalantha]|uniref:SRR1-like domain-containing protein n=1 Tax=Stephania cephalantha TaxID=152367 RepID=A0AAP0FDY3_9MAGN